jgi:large subunit ribosomal protein L25
MSEIMRLPAHKRPELGSAACRRLRRQGIVPGTVYGHRIPPVNIAIPDDHLQQILRSGGRVVDLDVDGQVEKAMLRDLQWDTFGMHVQHLDLLRVDPDERVTVEVAVELRGISPGASAGGVLEQPIRSLTIDCLAFHIPDRIVVRIGDLEIGQAVHVKDIEFAEGTKVLNPPDAIVVHVVEIAEEVETIEAEGVPTQPEVIGRKEKEEEPDDQGS